MKTKMLIIFSLTIICSFFTGCLFSEEEQEAVIIKDMVTSREGVLSNGRKFIFHGADQVTMTLEQFLEKDRRIYDFSYDFIVQEETVEDIFERLELELELSRYYYPNETYIIAYYLSESKDILFSVESFYGLRLGIPSVWGINHESGVVSYYTYNPNSTTGE